MPYIPYVSYAVPSIKFYTTLGKLDHTLESRDRVIVCKIPIGKTGIEYTFQLVR